MIKNGTKGIQIDNHVDDETTLTLSNTVISNMSIAGIYAQTANLDVYNTLIYNCDYYAAALIYGGRYNFVHTTLVNYAGRHLKPSLVFNNHYTIKKQNEKDEAHFFGFDAYFANSIIHGSLASEISIDVDTSAHFAFQFENCMLKVDPRFEMNDTALFKNVISDVTELPRFVNPAEGDFHLDTLSAAKDKGKAAYLIDFPLDLDGVVRDSLPDLGAYERIEQ